MSGIIFPKTIFLLIFVLLIFSSFQYVMAVDRPTLDKFFKKNCKGGIENECGPAGTGLYCNLETKLCDVRLGPVGGYSGTTTFTSYATTTLAGFVCQTANLVSQTLLPPIAVLMALVVGFLFLTSRGEPQKISLATRVLYGTLVGVFLLLVAPGIIALVNDLFGSNLPAPACGTDISTNTIITALLNLVNWFAWFTAVIAVAMGLYSGFLYITSRGNPQQTRQAALVLSYTIIGIAVAVVAFSIILVVEQILGT